MRAPRRGSTTGIVRLARLGTLAAALSGCARENVTEVVVRSVQVEPSQITVVAGSSVEFEAIVADDGGGSVTGADVEWSSDAPHVAFVDAEGIARAVSDGTATIEATFRDVTGAAKLTVLPASTIELVPASVDVYGGVDGEDPAAAEVAVGNRGGGPLEGLRTEVQYHEPGAEPWLEARLASARTPTTITLAPRIDGLPSGRHEATVLVRADEEGTTAAPLLVRLSLTGLTVIETGEASRVREDGTLDTLRVSLSPSPEEPVLVSVTSADTAEVSVSPPTLTFDPAVADTPLVVVLRGRDDPIADGDASTVVRIAVADAVADPAWRAAVPREVVVSTVDDDRAGVLLEPTAGGTVVREGLASDSVLVRLASQPEAGVEVRVVPPAGSPLTAVPARLVFNPADWNVPRPVALAVPDDPTVEGDRAWEVRFEAVAAPGSSYGSLDPSVLEVRVEEDDVAGVVVRGVGGATEAVAGEGGAGAALELLLAARPTSAVVLQLGGLDGTDAAVSPTSVSFTPDTWNVPRGVQVVAVDDDAVDGPRTHTLRVSAVPGSTADAFDDVSATFPVRTLDNEVADFVVTASRGNTVAVEAGATDTVTIVLSARPIGNVVIAGSLADPADAALEPASVTFTPGDWSTPRLVVFRAVDDAVPDGIRLHTLTFTVVPASSHPAFHGLIRRVSGVTMDNDGLGLVSAGPP